VHNQGIKTCFITLLEQNIREQKSRNINGGPYAFARDENIGKFRLDMGAQHEQSTLLEQDIALAEPPLYKVVLLNDDYTPMEFVVVVLQEFFLMDRASATLTMLKVHNEGKGTCGIFSKDVARTKVELVLNYARSEGHPLQCVMEEA